MICWDKEHHLLKWQASSRCSSSQSFGPLVFRDVTCALCCLREQLKLLMERWQSWRETAMGLARLRTLSTLAIWGKRRRFSWVVLRRCPSKARWETAWDIPARRGADLAWTFQGLLYSFLVCFDNILSSWERHTKFGIDAWQWISRKTVTIYLRSLIGLGRHYIDSWFYSNFMASCGKNKYKWANLHYSALHQVLRVYILILM